MSAKKKDKGLPLITNSKASISLQLEISTKQASNYKEPRLTIRSGNAQISESFARIIKDELFLFNAHIAEYEFGGDQNHEPQRPRKLLLKKRDRKVASRNRSCRKNNRSFTPIL